MTSNPSNVDISKSSGVDIEWKDGHKSHYDLQYLRDHCPCAMCTNKETHAPAAGPKPSAVLPMYKARTKLNDVESVGHYALRFFWNDGHSTGLYSYDHLRSICPCEECKKAEVRSQKSE